MTSRRGDRPTALSAIVVCIVCSAAVLAAVLLPPPFGLYEPNRGGVSIAFSAGGFREFTGTSFSFPITIPGGATVLVFIRQADSTLSLRLLVNGTGMVFVAEEAAQTGSQFFALVNAPPASAIAISQGGSAELDILAVVYTGVEAYVWVSNFAESGGPVSVSHHTVGLGSWVVGCASNSAGINIGNATVSGLPEGLTARVAQDGNGSINGWKIGDTNGIVPTGLNETVTANSSQRTGLAAWWIELIP